MNSILHNARRRAVAYATKNSLPQQLHNTCCQSISTTTHSLAMPAAKTSPDEARTAQKKVKKEKKGPSASKLAKETSAENKLYELQIKAFDAPGRDPPPASEEEMERRYHVGRDYVIGCFKRHNELNHDLAVKIRMKKYALKNLPREGIDIGDSLDQNGNSVYGKWKSEALKIDRESLGPPPNRHIPMYTPPIEGFDPSIYMDQEEED